jgi:hypothetical protein
VVAGAVTASAPLVLHLVWGPLGPGALREFLASYHSHDPGVAHDLVIVLNGVRPREGGAASRASLFRELEGTEHHVVELEHPVQDLVAYAQALRVLDCQRVCILNSHSRICADGWLSALDKSLSPADVGIVGATGSWAGMRSYSRYHLRLASPYRAVWPDRSSTLRAFRELAVERGSAPATRGLRSRLNTARELANMMFYCPAFPSPHLRTNAIMADRELLLPLLPDRLARKAQAYRLESGSGGITRQVREMGLRALVVDNQGRAFSPEDWPDSETFWQGTQRGLLVADNQTDAYARGDLNRRRVLSGFAWGERAAPL